MKQDPFASFLRFGDHVLDGLGRGDRSAQKFKFLLGVISETLVTTHRMVISRLRALQQAQTVDDAKLLLERLRSQDLSEAFRVEGLCDLLEGLGSGLLSRAWAADSEGAFSDEELTQVKRFGQMLYDREAEVARVYSEALSDITSARRHLDDSTLPELQRTAREIESLLTNHVADFRSKAERFTRVSIT